MTATFRACPHRPKYTRTLTKGSMDCKRLVAQIIELSFMGIKFQIVNYKNGSLNSLDNNNDIVRVSHGAVTPWLGGSCGLCCKATGLFQGCLRSNRSNQYQKLLET